MKKSTDRSLVVSGLATPSSCMRFGQLRLGSLVIAMDPSCANALGAERNACIDLTACAGRDAVVALERYAACANLVLVRDHQLESDELVEHVRRHNLSAIVLNAEIDYDTDISWPISRLEWAATRVAIKWFALDVFCGVERSWDTLLSTGSDEFTTKDLEEICRRFPVILSADTTLSNCDNVFSFPGAQGLLLTCNEISPILPPERHSMTPEDVYAMVANLCGNETHEQ